MLSEKLTAMARRIAEHEHTGMHADPDSVALMASNLRDMAEDAEQLEINTRPIAVIGGTASIPVPEGVNVVRLELRQ